MALRFRRNQACSSTIRFHRQVPGSQAPASLLAAHIVGGSASSISMTVVDFMCLEQSIMSCISHTPHRTRSRDSKNAHKCGWQLYSDSPLSSISADAIVCAFPFFTGFEIAGCALLSVLPVGDLTG